MVPAERGAEHQEREQGGEERRGQAHHGGGGGGDVLARQRVEIARRQRRHRRQAQEQAPLAGIGHRRRRAGERHAHQQAEHAADQHHAPALALQPGAGLRVKRHGQRRRQPAGVADQAALVGLRGRDRPAQQHHRQPGERQQTAQHLAAGHRLAAQHPQQHHEERRCGDQQRHAHHVTEIEPHRGQHIVGGEQHTAVQRPLIGTLKTPGQGEQDGEQQRGGEKPEHQGGAGGQVAQQRHPDASGAPLGAGEQGEGSAFLCVGSHAPPSGMGCVRR